MPDTTYAAVIPVAAAIMTRNAGLPSQDCALYTAAALASPSVLGLAGAVLATQRAREAADAATGAGTGSGTATPPPAPVIEMVDIPNVVGKSKDVAVATVEKNGLKADVRLVNYHVDKTKDNVIKQDPEAQQLLAAKGSTVVLTVSLGPVPEPVDEELQRDVAAFKQAILEVEAEKAAAAKASAKPQSQTSQSPTTGSGEVSVV